MRRLTLSEAVKILIRVNSWNSWRFLLATTSIANAPRHRESGQNGLVQFLTCCSKGVIGSINHQQIAPRMYSAAVT